MSARDNYPYLTRLGFPAEQDAEAAFAEIDRLRKANDFFREILDDVLPTVEVPNGSYAKICGHWIRIEIMPSGEVVSTMVT